MLQRRQVDLMPRIRGNEPERIGPESGDVHGLRDAAMRGDRHIGRELRAVGRDALASYAGAERGGPCDQHAQQVGHRCTGNEQPARRVGEAEQFAHPLDDLALNLDRRVIAPAQIGVEPPRQHFRQHSRYIAAAVHPSHEAGMAVAGAKRQDVTHELAMHRREVARLRRQRIAKMRKSDPARSWSTPS
jgi:hypothetical protein